MDLLSKIKENVIDFYTVLGYFYYSDLLTEIEWNVESEDVKDVFEKYGDVLKSVSNLCDELRLENPAEIYALFNVLYFNGLLSKDRKFSYCEDVLCEIPIIRGTNIITGKGCCRHLAAMLRDVFRERDIESYSIPVFLGDSERYVDKHIGNHSVTGAVYNGRPYFMDPLHLEICALDKLDKNGTLLLDHLGIPSSDIKPILFQYFNNAEPEVLEEILKMPKNTFGYLSEDVQDYRDATTNVSKHVNELTKFYNDNVDNYNEIADKVLKLSL